MDLANEVETCSNDTFLLSYSKKIGHSKKQIWLSPEVPEVIKTDIIEYIYVSNFCLSRRKVDK